jgi:hypothetical protein
MIREDDGLDADTLRALSLFALAGAQISFGDSTFLPSVLDAEQEPRSWVYVVAAMLPLATFVYLVASGG